MLRESFCSSPWIHLRLSYDGSFQKCRWSRDTNSIENISSHSLQDFYNSKSQKDFRMSMLRGEKSEFCKSCHYEDKFDKLSGRKKQLLKSAILVDDFELSTRSSPHYQHFLHSWGNQGESLYQPVDLQIDLGNLCNSGCVMCNPVASSLLEKDYEKLNKKHDDLFALPIRYQSWTKDPKVLARFIDSIKQIKNLGYVHLLGGETLIDPAFYTICDALIEARLSHKIIVGTTTNGTIYNDKIELYSKMFKEFHLGISIETISTLNDYIRWPSKINKVLENIMKFKKLRDESQRLYISLRITPNVFTIFEIDQLLEFMWEHDLAAESCNILHEPKHLMIELLPECIRQETINKLKLLINRLDFNEKKIINIRNRDNVKDTIQDRCLEYLRFLETYELPKDVEVHRKNLVRFLKSFESLRNNRITDHAPRYKEFLTAYGY
jgi:radical SAM protein with 4Fe4S-binding SPASM domain